MSPVTESLVDRSYNQRPALQLLSPHRAQFAIGPQFIEPEPGWAKHVLANDICLSADPALRIQELLSADGVRYFLLGYALLSDRKAKLEGVFSDIPSDDIVDWSASWSGRWLLITPEHCIPDASASLGLFYRIVQGTVWLSSSVALLANHIPEQAAPPRIPWGVVHERAMDWIPVPLTSRAGIFQVPPFRKIAIRTVQISPIQMPSLQSTSAGGTEEIASRLVTLAHNTEYLQFTERHVALTGGLDTRTILSAFLAAEVSFETATGITSSSSAADRRLPPRIAATVGVSHTFGRRAKVPEAVLRERRQVIAKHTDCQTAGTCVDHCAYAMEARLDGVQFGGLGFEVGRCYFWHRLTSPETINQFFREPVDERWYAALSQWVDLLHEQIPLSIDWRDRFYLEQRLGGWSSANNQCSDIVPRVHIHLANCAKLFQLMLLQPEADRKSGSVQLKIIKSLTPELADFPINPRSWSESAKRRSRHVARKALRTVRSVARWK